MRARNIKSAFFINEELAELSFEARILFIGLWCYADREGLFEWREKRIKATIFPYDDVNINCLLMSLHDKKFIYKYQHDGKDFGEVLHFKNHQSPHPHEAKSKIEKPQQNQCDDMSPTLQEMSGECHSDVRIEDTRNDDIRSEEKDTLTQIIELIKPDFPTLTPSQLKAAKDWIEKGKTLNDIQGALIKTAGSQRSATRWGWIVDEMNKNDKPDKPKKGRLRK